MANNIVCKERLFLFRPLFPLVAAGQWVRQNRGGRTSITLNSGWQFAKGDSASVVHPNKRTLNWQTVELPHTWNDKDVLADERRGYYQGIAWYKRWFSLLPETGKRYFLRFEGANQVTEVHVNGKIRRKAYRGLFRLQHRFDSTPGRFGRAIYCR